jgi:hypothetical protein
METRTIVQDRHPEPHRIRKELWKLALTGGAAFWIVDFAMALSPIGEVYRDAFSISNLPLALVEALAGGLMVACIVSYLLLRFAGRIPFKNPISKGLILSLAAMLVIEVLSTLVDPVHAFTFLFIDTAMNLPRFLALGIAIGYGYTLIKKGKRS